MDGQSRTTWCSTLRSLSAFVTAVTVNSKTNTDYRTMSGDQITVVDHAKDLGVTMSSDGTFRQHIYNLTDTGLKLAGWVLRTFRTRHKVPMLTPWKSLILSKLDYCSQLWNPSQTGEIQALEQVQRYFVRRISGIHHLNYWQQLRALSPYSLERRRERYMTIYVWKDKYQTSPILIQEA